jgi:cytochrome c-type biogenesis protein CcmH
MIHRAHTPPHALVHVARALCLAILVMLLAPAARAIDTTTLSDPALQARYLKLTHELRCMQCQNVSIADSEVDLAADLRDEVRDLLLAGKSDDEIRAYFVARYGEFILFRPLVNARNMWLWAAPGVFLLVGILIAIRVVRQRAALVAQDDQPVEEDAGR